MSKRYNIRWTENDDDNLRKSVKNFNAKITRLENKINKILETSEDKDVKEQARQLKNALPDRVSVKAKRDLITTRQDLKRELNSLQRFTQKGSEELVPLPDNKNNILLTKWQKQDIELRTRSVNINRAKMLEAVEKLPATSRGQDLGYNVGMGDTDLRQFEPLKPFNPSMDRTSLNKRHLSVIKESQNKYWQGRNNILRETYVNTIRENFGDNDKTKKIIDKINRLSPDEFYGKFKQDVDAWEYNYPLDEKDASLKLQGLEDMWLNDVIRPKLNTKKKSTKKKKSSKKKTSKKR